MVYTIAGVAVVATGAGAIYYFSDPRKSPGEDKKRPSKKERRKAKQEREKTQARTEATSPTSAPAQAAREEPDPLEGLPEINESVVATLSDEVGAAAVELDGTVC